MSRDDFSIFNTSLFFPFHKFNLITICSLITCSVRGREKRRKYPCGQPTDLYSMTLDLHPCLVSPDLAPVPHDGSRFLELTF